MAMVAPVNTLANGTTLHVPDTFIGTVLDIMGTEIMGNAITVVAILRVEDILEENAIDGNMIRK